MNIVNKTAFRLFVLGLFLAGTFVEDFIYNINNTPWYEVVGIIYACVDMYMRAFAIGWYKRKG